MTVTTPAPFSIRESAQPGVRAVARYWKPFVLIQMTALVLVCCYFYLPEVRSGCEVLARWSVSGGIWVAVLASAVAGGILPEVAKGVTGTDRRPLRARADEAGFNFAYFAVVGVQVYYFYKLQSWLWGDGNDVGTLAKKVALDQLAFTPFLSMPFSLYAFAWRKHGYSWRATAGEVTAGWLLRRLPALVIPAMAFWTPMVSMVYSLPGALQFPLFTLALAAWSLLLVFLAKGE